MHSNRERESEQARERENEREGWGFHMMKKSSTKQNKNHDWFNTQTLSHPSAHPSEKDTLGSFATGFGLAHESVNESIHQKGV